MWLRWVREGELPSTDYTHRGGGERPPSGLYREAQGGAGGGGEGTTEWGDKGEAQTETIISGFPVS